MQSSSLFAIFLLFASLASCAPKGGGKGGKKKGGVKDLFKGKSSTAPLSSEYFDLLKKSKRTQGRYILANQSSWQTSFRVQRQGPGIAVILSCRNGKPKRFGKFKGCKKEEYVKGNVDGEGKVGKFTILKWPGDNKKRILKNDRGECVACEKWLESLYFGTTGMNGMATTSEWSCDDKFLKCQD